ncbi:hypothetical protein J2Y45_006654 [Dyadobacter sp. BE34]|nr:hypothetical protein [Dyadobacter sp. BE242]MDR7201490.1 hypothetical protein [Dyadobacter sp. BE34]MDR7219360.1 hypothetical protein [Dyadobacter sp. BE31]MDR7267126.1 hypothetical protein [Dyadobacter sp. BE32]
MKVLLFQAAKLLVYAKMSQPNFHDHGNYLRLISGTMTEKYP